MEIKGKVICVLPIEGGTSSSGREWKKSGFVIEAGGEYPKKIAFTLFGDEKIAIAPNPNELVNVHFDIESREFKGRWFTDINAWKVDSIGGTSSQQGNVAQSPQPQQTQTQPNKQQAYNVPLQKQMFEPEQKPTSEADVLPF